MKIVATSETGATYEIEDGFWRHRRGEWHKTWDMRNVDYETIRHYAPNGEMFWVHINSQDRAEMPEVGKSLFVSGRDYWRVSTPIVKVEVVE